MSTSKPGRCARVQERAQVGFRGAIRSLPVHVHQYLLILPLPLARARWFVLSDHCESVAESLAVEGRDRAHDIRRLGKFGECSPSCPLPPPFPSFPYPPAAVGQSGSCASANLFRGQRLNCHRPSLSLPAFSSPLTPLLHPQVVAKMLDFA